jgi:hypothetical protein
VALPIPLVAPVMMATLSASFMFVSSSLFYITDHTSS